jgi:hypothetical protein
MEGQPWLACVKMWQKAWQNGLGEQQVARVGALVSTQLHLGCLCRHVPVFHHPGGGSAGVQVTHTRE